MTPTNEVIEKIARDRIVAVLRSNSMLHVAKTVEVLLAEGITAVELTLTTTGALDELESLRNRFGASATFGVGTVRSAHDAESAVNAGAEFLVTPVVVPDALVVGERRAVPVICGAYTPTEIHHAMALGAQAVKVFPASALSPQYLRELRGPFPQVRAMPSGGLSIGDIAPWLTAGAVAVSLGGALTGHALEGDFEGLRERARAVGVEVGGVST